MLGTTICAISTASGVGAIGIVRISGDKSHQISETIIAKRNQFVKLEAKKMLYTELIDNDGSVIDEVMVAKFQAPASFTGEDMVEIYCHGSEYITHKILTSLVHNGAVLAEPGEFTQRAFVNGKMDLSQSEAVADLISSNSQESHMIAMRQLKGSVSSKIAELRGRMLNLTSLLELELDFSEEDVEFADRSKLLVLIDEICGEIQRLIRTFEYGNAIKNGIPVAIVGEPNAGKSTLLNALLHEDRAIVSSVAGTTRDTIEEEFVIDGLRFRFIDTAGIHKAESDIEEQGIARTFAKIKSAKIVILVLDASKDAKHNEEIISALQKEILEGSYMLLVRNKTDLVTEKANNDANVVEISALKEVNIDVLCKRLTDYVRSLKPESSDVIITNVRHITSLESTYKLLESAKDSIISGVATDFVAQDLREANLHLGEIIGAISTDEVLGNIFSKFCIGK